MARRSSNTNNTSTLPSIPEYPGFQDIKDLGRTRPEHPPNTSCMVQDRSPGCSAEHLTEGHCRTSRHFSDKSLEDYFNERLSELRNYEPKASNGKMKSPPDENQTPNSSGRSSHRSSCSAVSLADHMELSDELCDSADQSNESAATCIDQQCVQNGEECCNGDYLECLTRSINAPLQMLVQRK